jgi:hypothetical protein
VIGGGGSSVTAVGGTEVVDLAVAARAEESASPPPEKTKKPMIKITARSASAMPTISGAFVDVGFSGTASGTGLLDIGLPQLEQR